MVEVESALVEAILPSQVGRHASFRRYDRALNTPINFVLNEAQRALSSEFSVYWVEGGLPEMFCLSGFIKPPVVYNTRYIEMTYLVRKLFTLDYAPSLEDLSERVFLKLMAEFAVRHGRSDWAIRAFLKSMLGQGFSLLDLQGVALLDLEAQPINEAYVATWCFGLLHELGHLHPAGSSGGIDGGPFAEKTMLGAVESALDLFPYPASLKEEALREARRDRDSLLSPARLSSESGADLFSIAVLFEATPNLIKKAGQGTFRVDQFAAEMFLALSVIVLLDRCKRVALISAMGDDERREKSKALGLHVVAGAVRSLMAHDYLQHALAVRLFRTDSPSAEQLDKCLRLLNEINTALNSKMTEIEKGLAQAMRFALLDGKDDSNLLTRFAREQMGASVAFDVMEAVRFSRLVESFGQESESTEAFTRIANGLRAARGSAP